VNVLNLFNINSYNVIVELIITYLYCYCNDLQPD